MRTVMHNKAAVETWKHLLADALLDGVELREKAGAR